MESTHVYVRIHSYRVFSKKHIAVSPEQKGIIAFKKQLEDANYAYTQMIFRIPNDVVINLDLLRSIDYNIQDKRELKTFLERLILTI